MDGIAHQHLKQTFNRFVIFLVFKYLQASGSPCRVLTGLAGLQVCGELSLFNFRKRIVLHLNESVIRVFAVHLYTPACVISASAGASRCSNLPSLIRARCSFDFMVPAGRPVSVCNSATLNPSISCNVNSEHCSLLSRLMAFRIDLTIISLGFFLRLQIVRTRELSDVNRFRVSCKAYRRPPLAPLIIDKQVVKYSQQPGSLIIHRLKISQSQVGFDANLLHEVLRIS